MSKRIGPVMAAAAAYVAAHPGTAKLPVARTVGPHGSARYGYDAVDRAIRAGLVEDRAPAGSFAYQLHAVTR